MKKKNIVPVVVLVVICIAVAAVLGTVNYFTAPIIAERNDLAIKESLGKVMPDGEFNSEPDVLRGAPETISKLYTEINGKGTVAVLVTNQGYTGKDIALTVGIDASGKITGLVITQNDESIVPSMLKPGGNYGDAYVGASAKDIATLETGATVAYTESAIKNAITDVFVYLGFATEKPEIPREEEELLVLVKDFYGDSTVNLKCVKNDGEFVKRIYQEKGKTSYVAYAFTYSQYGTPEFEFLIHVNEDGTVKAVKKILWKVSDPKPEWGYVPPTEERVDELFQSFVSKNADTVMSVDVKTGATNTAERVRTAAAEAIKCGDVINASSMPRITGIILLSVAVISAACFVVFRRRGFGVK